LPCNSEDLLGQTLQYLQAFVCYAVGGDGPRSILTREEVEWVKSEEKNVKNADFQEGVTKNLEAENAKNPIILLPRQGRESGARVFRRNP